MKFKLSILIIAALLVFSANVLAQENTTGNVSKKGLMTIIDLDTKGQTGNLKYIEAYFVINSSGNLTIDKTLEFYNGSINQSKIQLKILRPLKDGKSYPAIRAIAILDNKTILNSWYKVKSNSSASNDPNSTGGDGATKKSPGFEGIILIMMFLMVCIFKKYKKT